MRIQVRLALLLAAVTVAVALAMWSLQWSNKHEARVLLENIRHDREILLENLLTLTSRPTKLIVQDYSLWGEMVSFVQTRDKTWAKVNIDDGIPSYSTDAAWVFLPDFTPIYSTNRLGSESLATLPVPAADLAALTSADHFPHFFIDTQAGIMEVWGAPIQPSDDIDRRTPPQGWFLAGRSWDAAYLQTLSKFTDTTITLLPGSSAPPAATATSQSIDLYRALPDWKGRPLRLLHSQHHPAVVDLLVRENRTQIILFCLLGGVFALLAFYGANWEVARPLQALEKSLANHDTAPLARLKNSATEFGRLAHLVETSFAQQTALGHEIEERKRIEAALRDSEERYRHLFENSHLGVYRTTPDGRILAGNPALTALLGYASFADLAAHNLEAEPHLASPTRRQFKELMERQGEVRGFEAEWPRSDGRAIFVRENAKATRDETGAIKYYEGTIEDITERRRAEEALRASETRLRNLMTASPVVFFILRAEVDRVYPVWCAPSIAQFGYTEADAVTPGWWESNLHPDERATMVQTLPTVLKSGRLQREFRLRCKSGEYRWVRDVLAVVEGSAGREIIGIWLDITERKRAEESMQQLFALLNSIDDLILINDATSLRFVYANEGATRQLGYTREELLAMTPGELDIEATREGMQKSNAEFARGERTTLTLNTRYRRKDGQTFPVEVRIQYYAPADGPAVCLAVARDITERRLIEQQRLRAQRLESIGTLAGGVAHDLNNIFTPLVLLVEELRNYRTAPEPELLDMIETGLKRGTGMVRQLLTFGRGIEGERLPLQPAELLGEVTRIVASTFPKSIRLEAQFASDLWPVLGDATQLHQVILNLCVNARDAMPDGGILTLAACNLEVSTAQLSTWPEAMPGHYVMIEVRDTGKGISAEIMDRIFEPFFSTKQPDQGTGLGLPTALGIIKSHGGFIRVASEVGLGTTCRVLLPATGANANRTPAPARDMYDGQNRLALLVDDEPAIRSATRKLLERMQFRVIEATDSREALALCAQHRHDLQLIITDVHMPDMDGVGLIRALRKVESPARIIVMSGRFDDHLKLNLIDLEISVQLEKPFSRQELVAALCRALH